MPTFNPILILGRLPMGRFEFAMETVAAFLAGDLRGSKGKAVANEASVRTANIFVRSAIMPGNIFYIIGVVVVVLFILGYLGLR